MDADDQRTWHGIREVLGSKWAMHVVAALDGEEHGFNELRRELGGVTAKVLSARLRELRCLGFVEREVHATTPPTTTYRLTDHGTRLAVILDDVADLVDVMDCPDPDCPVDHCIDVDGGVEAAACDC